MRQLVGHKGDGSSRVEGWEVNLEALRVSGDLRYVTLLNSVQSIHTIKIRGMHDFESL